MALIVKYNPTQNFKLAVYCATVVTILTNFSTSLHRGGIATIRFHRCKPIRINGYCFDFEVNF